MACGMIAMLNAGIEVESYDAYEIDKYAIKVSSHNFPNIRHHGDVFQADFTQHEGVDFLVGGSPCTYWSIAQKNNRETEASGMGWELFSQYVRAVREAKPKFFIYENNKSMSPAIRASIDEAFGFESTYINSSLVSAQHRQRLYWVGMRNTDGSYSKVQVDQPENRGVLLRDILDSCFTEQTYELRLDSITTNPMRDDATEPIRIGDIGSTAQAHRVYSCDGKSVTINAGGGGQGGKTGLYMCPLREQPLNITEDGKSQTIKATYSFTSVVNICCYNSTYGSTGVAIPTDDPPSEQFTGKGKDTLAMKRIYEVKDGLITIRGEQYPIDLADGCYIIRKLTVTECMRLQTVPEWYDFSVISNSQAYKCLGNGWTCDVITHLINATQKATRKKWLDDLLGDCL